jgi:hypothetical protein
MVQSTTQISDNIEDLHNMIKYNFIIIIIITLNKMLPFVKLAHVHTNN